MVGHSPVFQILLQTVVRMSIMELWTDYKTILSVVCINFGFLFLSAGIKLDGIQDSCREGIQCMYIIQFILNFKIM